ncbi:alpha/beta fold hydrolase [Aciditerrimonas ferrireducens]|uniref:Alpha/beta fold hydrolase n=1 Tax=Aciditerrimonas ferrireducens TaxID=667306 RepID=A0ABV6C2E6_9ACTN
MERIPYDEFGLLAENAAELGLPSGHLPPVRRVPVPVGRGRHLSALVWGDAPPEVVLLHGGAQNAHTWDSVALVLDRPLVALDLPGHGHADDARVHPADVASNAEEVAEAVAQLAPAARAVVGMSLGGLTALALAGQRPELVRALVLVDITPGVTPEKSQAVSAFVRGPSTFPSFEALLERTVAHHPQRSVASLRRGILHNAVQLEDGTWRWRHARGGTGVFDAEARMDPRPLWDVLGSSTVPLLLVRGLRPDSVVDDEDEAELRRRRPDAQVVHVPGAGHSVQGDAPAELGRILRSFLDQLA